jgi:ankyrin repeat domain-containing protein 50
VHDHIVTLLLDASADPDAQDYMHNTPFHYVSQNGHDAVVKQLLERGVNINAQNFMDEPPETYTGSTESVKFCHSWLLENGVDTKGHQWYRELALHRAVKEQSNSLIDLFLEYGVNIEARNTEGLTPFLTAMRGGLKS